MTFGNVMVRTVFTFLLLAPMALAQTKAIYVNTVNGANGADVPIASGTVALALYVEVPNCCTSTIVTSFQLTVNGTAVLTAPNAPSTVNFDTTTLPDGIHTFSFAGLPADAWPVPRLVLVDNVPGVATQNEIQVCGYYQTYAGIGPGTATNPACFTRALPLPAPVNYPHVATVVTPFSIVPSRADMIVEHITATTSLFRESHWLWKHRNGERFATNIYSNVGSDYRTFPDGVDRFPSSDGPRGVGFVSPYITGAVHPTTGELYFVEKARTFGRLGKIALDGTVTTLAGFRLKANEVPCFFRDPACDHAATKELVGDWSGYPPGRFTVPYDLTFDLSNPTKIYVADLGAGRVALVDLSVSPVEVSSLASGFSEPMSVAATDDGVWVLERGSGDVHKISGGVVQPPVLTGFLAGVQAGDTICMRSAGHGTGGQRHFYMSKRTGIYHFRPADSDFRLEGSLPATNQWIWFDVDRDGTFGPMGPTWNHLLVAIFGPWETLYRFDPSVQTWTTTHSVDFTIESRANETGTGHYPWMVAVGRGALWSTGIGTLGVQRTRLVTGSGELPLHTADYTVYQRGRALWNAGCGNGCVWGSVPSYSTTHGPFGWTPLGALRNIDEVATLGDTALDAEFLGGLGTGIPRSFTTAELSDLRFFVRRSSVYGTRNLSLVPPPPPEPVCGNAILETGEGCDDGNLLNGDGCSDTCTVEPPPPPPSTTCGAGTTLQGTECVPLSFLLNCTHDGVKWVCVQ